MLERGSLSRRGFARTSLGFLAASGLPAWYAGEVFAAAEESAAKAKKPIGPNDTIRMGLIGCGGQGTGDMRWASQHKGVKCVAVCDVDRDRRNKAAQTFNVDEKAKYNDFRELLARDDVDAVVIGTPDHWHTLVAIEASKRKKDIYCEKPLTLTIAEGQALVKAVRSNDVVFQVGSQQRSDARFRLACELVRNDRLGKIQTVETRIGDNPKQGPFWTSPVPDGLDWNFWLGQTAEVPYIKERGFYEFRWWYEYSGGKMTDWGAHHNDIAQWGLGADGSGPIAVEGKGEAPLQEQNCYNCHPHFTVRYKYANGAELICMSEGENGVKFTGDRGWIFVDRGKITSSDKALLDEKLKDDANRLYKSDDHMANFLDCVRDRKRPICDVEVGHRSVSVCHIGTISTRLGKALKWDPSTERFDDEAANRMLHREMRAPWKLEV